MNRTALVAWMVLGALQLATPAEGWAEVLPVASVAPAADEARERSEFVDQLLSRMTLEEKIGQLTLFTSDQQITGPSGKAPFREGIRSGKVGAVFNAFGAETTRELQAIAVNESRLKIPLLIGLDVIHGHRTIFPISLGEAASWDLEAIEKSARISAIEASAEGVNWTFAPMVDIAR
ncbi:MAG: glycoside hydrolase family 3 N-terminal domain-containing protein, partial [Pseudomonadota bacterium]